MAVQMTGASVITVRRMQNGPVRVFAVKSRALGAPRCGFGA